MTTKYSKTSQTPPAGFIQQSLIAGILLTVSLGLSVLVSGLIGHVSGLTTDETPANSIRTELSIEVSEHTPGAKAIWTLLIPRNGSEG